MRESGVEDDPKDDVTLPEVIDAVDGDGEEVWDSVVKTRDPVVDVCDPVVEVCDPVVNEEVVDPLMEEPEVAMVSLSR